MSTVTWDVCQRDWVDVVLLKSLSEGVCSPYKAPCFIKHCAFLSRSTPVTSCFSSGTKQQWWLDKTDCKTPEGRRFFMNNKLTDCYRRTSHNVTATGNSSHQIKPSFTNHEFRLNTQRWWRKKAEMKEAYFNFPLDCFYQSCVERTIHEKGL